MIAKTCQIQKRYPDIRCSQPSAGFLLRTDESPTAVYQEGMVVCKGHGAAMEGEDGNGDYQSLRNMADLMNDEERTAYKGLATPQHEDTDMTTTAQTLSLTDLAVHMNGNNGDTPVQVPQSTNVPDTDDSMDSMASGKPAPTASSTVTAAMIQDWRDLAYAKYDQAQALRTLADSNPSLAAILKGQAAQLDKEAEGLMRKAEKHTDPIDELKKVLGGGGQQALVAFEDAITSGLLKVQGKSRRISADGASEKKASDPEREALKAKVLALHAQGVKESDIVKQLQANPNQVRGYVHRATHAA